MTKLRTDLLLISPDSYQAGPNQSSADPSVSMYVLTRYPRLDEFRRDFQTT